MGLSRYRPTSCMWSSDWLRLVLGLGFRVILTTPHLNHSPILCSSLPAPACNTLSCALCPSPSTSTTSSSFLSPLLQHVHLGSLQCILFSSPQCTYNPNPIPKENARVQYYLDISTRKELIRVTEVNTCIMGLGEGPAADSQP